LPSNTTPLAVPWRLVSARTRLLGSKRTRDHYPRTYRAVGPLGSSRSRVIPARHRQPHCRIVQARPNLPSSDDTKRGPIHDHLKEDRSHLVHAKLTTVRSRPHISSDHSNSIIPARSP
ncbi:hypothetical protein QBC41DRAFT_392424, partial [Cercophora samala]